MKKYIFLALAFHASVSAVFAADWKSLGYGWYVDSSSAKKYGDIGVVTIRFNDMVGEASFDCVRNLALEPKSWVNDQPITTNDPIKGVILKTACSKWYEVWKR